MTYHGIIQWRLEDDTEIHHSSFAIDREPGSTYAYTKIQFTNAFTEKIREELGDSVIIEKINIKSTDKIAHLS